MGLLANYKCTSCSGFFKNQSHGFTQGMETLKISYVCKNCTCVFLKVVEEDGVHVADKFGQCPSCKSTSVVEWDGTCPYCHSPTKISGIGDFWD